MEFYNPAKTKSRVFGFDGALHLVDEDGCDKRLPIPAIHPFDDVQIEWPKTALYFVDMCNVRHAIIASTMREACDGVEKASGWD